MDGQVTKEEIVEIVTGFLLNSPPGEFMEVVTDVRGLLSDESIINDSAPSTFKEYNTDQMLQVQSPGGNHKVLISKTGEVSPGEYLDPRGNQIVLFDHIRQEVTGSRAISGELDSQVEPFRSAFDDAAVHYVSEHYLNGTTTVYGKKRREELRRYRLHLVGQIQSKQLLERALAFGVGLQVCSRWWSGRGLRKTEGKRPLLRGR